MAPGDEKAADDAFVGYNEWAAESLKVQVATDFVYETQEGACEAERGVFIAEDVTPHTEVFSIPLDSVLSVKSLQENAVLQGIEFFQQLTPEREDDQLAIALLYEKFVLGSKSKWSKHIELLPQTYYNALYIEQEVLKLLEGSNLFFIAQQMEQKVALDYARLKESVLLELFENVTEGINFDLFDEYFSFENYKWALSTIWSRFVKSDAPVAKQSFKAMVPVFDMLNHDPEAEMSHFFDMDTQRFKLVSHQHWNAGAQMFINYGALSNHKLLSLYGFVIIGNPFDAVEMWLPMDEGSAFFHEKEQLLLSNGLDHASNPFELVADETNDLLLMATRIQEINCETVEEFEALAHKALDGQMVSLENEQEALSRLIYTLEKMLEAFPTSIEEDDQLLESWEDNLAQQGDERSDRLNHERMAVAVCRSDKYILSENINMLKWKLLDILPKN
ncbi:Putative histone-lysine N-methyltransferase [Phytophthora palmivora]|uniref:Histone-lysine N-methyltransferase n=1 Tax=Phytophthora palmivora TaxID=4796 RepID=A0A2P4WYX0_9STRA|nr:Putative histone-lysine N-methyltransferase [Phytophthora palmivora]